MVPGCPSPDGHERLLRESEEMRRSFVAPIRSGLLRMTSGGYRPEANIAVRRRECLSPLGEKVKRE